jgi:hypothetical protein
MLLNLDAENFLNKNSPLEVHEQQNMKKYCMLHARQINKPSTIEKGVREARVLQLLSLFLKLWYKNIEARVSNY